MGSLPVILITADYPFELEFLTGFYWAVFLCFCIISPVINFRCVRQWRKIDLACMWWVGTSISFGFLVKETHGTFDSWCISTTVGYALATFSLTGNLRSMLKWFPWTFQFIFMYKLVRFYTGVFFVCILVAGQNGSFNGSKGVLSYFSTTISWVSFLFLSVFFREQALRNTRRAKKISQQKD